MTELLSKEHTILERPFMEFPPFGRDEHGDKIRDISGVIVQANVEYLEDCVAMVSPHVMFWRGTPRAGSKAGKNACAPSTSVSTSVRCSTSARPSVSA